MADTRGNKHQTMDTDLQNAWKLRHFVLIPKVGGAHTDLREYPHHVEIYF